MPSFCPRFLPYIFFVLIVRVDEFFENVRMTSTLKISLKVLNSDALVKRLNESTIDIHTVEIESMCKLHQVLNRYSLPSCLKVLRIDDNNLEFEDISDLVTSLSCVNSLHELDLCRTKFTESCFYPFIFVLRRCKNLRSLSLTDNGLTKTEVTSFLTIFESMENLKKLNLSKSNITEAQANDILHKIEQAKKITSLDLSYNALQGNEIIVRICQLQSLEELDLSHNYIKFFPLPDFEGKHDSLSINAKNISLSSSHMTPDDISAFCSLIGSDLLKLNLDFNHVSNSIWSLCSIRLRIKHLKVLSLANTGISDLSAVRGLAFLLSFVREIEELDLSSNNLTLADFQQIQLPLSNLSQLKRLNLSNNPHGISALLEKILPSLKKMEELRLSNTHLNGDDLKRICYSLASFKSLKYLELSMNTIGPDGIKELANILKEFPLLERLDLSRSCLQGDDINVLCQGLVPLKKMKSLDLSGNIIDSQILDDAWLLPPTLEELTFSDVIHGEKLFAEIKTLQNLEKLHLSNLKLRACDVEILATTLSSFPKMEELSLADIVIACSCGYDCKCYEQLFSALGSLKYLKELELIRISIDKTGAKALARVLPSLTLLEKLVLGYIPFDNECDEQQLFAALENLKYLKELDLERININKTGAEALTRVLPSLTLLEKLVIGRIVSDDECDEQLFAALGNLKYLKELDLSRININKTCAEALARVLPSLTLLEKLELRVINLYDECGEHALLAALGNVKYLKELELIRISIDKTGAKALARVLPSLTLLEKLVLGKTDLDYECDHEQLLAALDNLKYLKELDLSRVCINKTDAEALARVLPSLTLLEKLKLGEIDLDCGCDEQLFAALGNLKYLKELDLGCVYINKTGAEALARVLPSLTLLEKLELEGIDLDDQCDELDLDDQCDEHALFAALGNLKYLKELYLGGNNFNKISAESTARVLQSLTLLEKLALGNILFYDEYNKHALFAALANLKSLKELDLGEVRIEKTGAKALARVLQSLTLLEKLVLGCIRTLGNMFASDDKCNKQLFAALGNLKYLKELDLSRIDINKTCAEALARVLPSLTLLEKLVLGEIDLDDECDEQLLAALGNLKYLKELDLSRISIKVCINRTGAKALARVLSSLTFLEKLVLGYIPFKCYEQQLFAAFENLKYLKELDFSRININKTGAKALARVLPSLTRLEKLGEIGLGYECDGQLLPALGNLKYLKELYLSGNNFNKISAKALARVLPSLTLLEKLELGGIDLDDECDEQLFATLGNLKYLKELYLSGNDFNKISAKALARVLPSLTLLKKLVLGHILFDDALFAALGNLIYLKELDLGKVYISETGAESLAHVLPPLTFLEKLVLREIDVDYECDEQLFAPLGNFKYLKELDLSAICIGKTGAEALARVFPSLTLLEKLVLEGIDFDYECDEHALFASLGNLKYLKELYLDGVYISKTGAATLTTTLPRLRSLKLFWLPRIKNDKDKTLKNNLRTAASFVPEVY